MSGTGVFSDGGAYLASVQFSCGKVLRVRCRSERAGFALAVRAYRRAPLWKERGHIMTSCKLEPI